jgi:lysyl-tRNA synthetase class 1
MEKKEVEKDIFWADQFAKSLIERKKFHYLDKEIHDRKEFIVKTSASISGVLHIGRLSDSIRGSSVFRALKEQGAKAKLIWVAEDMDPLRKIPEGVPKSYEQHIGMPVTDIPDPDGCHKTYAEHHVEEYLKVLDKFVDEPMEKFSMRQEYKKGSFKPFIKKLFEKREELVEIQNKYRTKPLKEPWSPWTPICDNCGKIVTTQIKAIEKDKVKYVCKDYYFEESTATGCGFEGENNPLEGKGKLLWKSEWATEWAHWKVSAEGAGKEYQVPNSAWWVNAEISEKILDYPAPEPIFYEHLMIEGVKMSASLGNVVYPKDWLYVASPQLLRFLYNKRLMVTRSFSWKDLLQLYDEYDWAGKVYFGLEKEENEKESIHLKRLYEMSNFKEIEKPLAMSFSHATVIAQLFHDKDDIVFSLEKTGHYDKKHEKEIFERLEKANKWLTKYAPEEMKFSLQKEIPAGVELSEKQKKAVRILVKEVKEKNWTEKTLHKEIYEIAKGLEIEPKELFVAGYRILLNRNRGPKLAHFILASGDKAIKLLEKV